MTCEKCKYHIKENDSHGNVACLIRTIRTHGYSLEPMVLVPLQTNCDLGVLPHKEDIPKIEPYDRKKYKMQFGNKREER